MMEKLWVSNMVDRTEDAMDLVNEYAARNHLTDRDRLHLNLLMEEALGMMRQKVENFDGEIWLEGDRAQGEVVLEITARNSGESMADPGPVPEGVMAKIAEVLECAYRFENAEFVPDSLRNMLPEYIRKGDPEEKASVWTGQWLLSQYRASLLQQRREQPENEAALEELEKSVVAQIADDVTVGIRGGKIRMAMTKKWSGR